MNDTLITEKLQSHELLELQCMGRDTKKHGVYLSCVSCLYFSQLFLEVTQNSTLFQQRMVAGSFQFTKDALNVLEQLSGSAKQ